MSAMPGLEALQGLVDNDLRRFREPFFPGMARQEEGSWSVPSLQVFQGWLVGGIVGGRHPSRYSESPRLWNLYFRELGVAGVFQAFDLPAERLLGAFLSTLLCLEGFVDLTVTDPFKAAVPPALAALSVPVELAVEAADTGVVNHLVPSGRGLLGLNTDGAGMLRALRRRGAPEGGRVLLIGAGGSAASIGYELVRAGFHLTVVNRTPERARRLARRLGRFAAGGAAVRGGGFDAMGEALREADVVVSAVPRGCPLGAQDAGRLRSGVVLADTRYGKDAQLRALAPAGGAFVDGLEMLIGQFVEAAGRVRERLGVEEARHRRAVQAVEALAPAG